MENGSRLGGSWNGIGQCVRVKGDQLILTEHNMGFNVGLVRKHLGRGGSNTTYQVLQGTCTRPCLILAASVMAYYKVCIHNVS